MIKKYFGFKMCKKFDIPIHLAVSLLLLFGTIMIISASIGESGSQMNVMINAAIKQGVAVFIAYWGMTILARNYGRFFCKEVVVYKNKENNKLFKKNMKILFYGIGIGVIVLLVMALMSTPLNAARSWIVLPGIGTIQPSEFAKVYMILLLGYTVSEWGGITSIKVTRYMLIPFSFFALTAILISLQPDFGTLMVYTIIIALLVLIPAHPCMKVLQKVVLTLSVVGVGSFIFLNTETGISLLNVISSGYKFDRFTSAADPFLDLYDSGYHIVYSLYAIANGRLSGLGLGSSEQKLGYLPEAESDFIFSVVIEELGIVGLIVIVVLYGIIVIRLINYALKSQQEGYKIILMGTALYMVVHFIINIGGVSGLIPLTGIPLLFISAGNSSLLSIMTLIGVSQSLISIENNVYKKNPSGEKGS